MGQAGLFSILHSVDSTNNYAMAKLHAGLANHGMAWFAEEQFNGKGQRGKQWQSSRGLNLVLSVVIEPVGMDTSRQFELSVITALACHRLFQKYAGPGTSIKWPNDIYFRDRKAGGILIENILHGRYWKFSVIGIGININQRDFDDLNNKAISLSNITGQTFNPVDLAMELHSSILENFEQSYKTPFSELLEEYNQVLYKRGEKVLLRKNNLEETAYINCVDSRGRLITGEEKENIHEFGSVEWMIMEEG